MNLRNYDNFMASKQLCVINGECISRGEHTNFTDGHLTVKTRNKNSPSICRLYHSRGSSDYGSYNPFYTGSDAYRGLICGGGDTPVTYDDYDLDIPFTSTEVSFVSHEISDTVYDEATNTFTRTYKKMFSAKTDLIIKEIGFSVYVSASTSATSSNGNAFECLMYRKVLDEPIEIEKNASFELTFTTVVSACANKPTEYEASVTTE